MLNINEHLLELYNLHQACQKFRHGVRERPDDWKLS